MEIVIELKVGSIKYTYTYQYQLCKNNLDQNFFL